MMRRPRLFRLVRLVTASTAVGAVLACASANADDGPPALFRDAVAELAAERPSEAIAKLESLGDHGVVDAVVSYDRGLAYAARVRAGAAQEGDLGRAAHAFEEARELTRDANLARDATMALGIVRAEIAKRRAREGDPAPLDHGVSLGRSIVGLVHENAWAALAILCAIVLSFAIVVRARAAAGRAKVAATTTAAVSATLLGLSGLLAFAARDARLHLREGVVVAPSARLLDDRHIAKGALSPVPEGARVRILDESGGYSRIALSTEDGYLPSSSVLPLARR